MKDDSNLSDAGEELVDDATRAADEKAAATRSGAGAMPTADEAAAADEAATEAPDVEEAYRDMTAKGARVKGEGEI